MPGRIRRWAEKLSLAGLALAGFAVVAADMLGWLDKLAPGGISTITLLLLSGVTVVLVLEVDRLHAVDRIDKRLEGLDIAALAAAQHREHYAGVVKVHKRFPDDVFSGYVGHAKHVTILNNWIPNLDLLERQLESAILDRRAEVRIMLLHPKSLFVGLREEALRGRSDDSGDGHVRTGVTNCLETLARMHRRMPRRQGNLKVRVFNSLTSVSVYHADQRYLVSMFLHGQLAIHSPQFEIEGSDTVLGEQIQRELDTLWDIGRDVDLTNWVRSIDMIRF
jgi:hypothetical protein